MFQVLWFYAPWNFDEEYSWNYSDMHLDDMVRNDKWYGMVLFIWIYCDIIFSKNLRIILYEFVCSLKFWNVWNNYSLDNYIIKFQRTCANSVAFIGFKFQVMY